MGTTKKRDKGIPTTLSERNFLTSRLAALPDTCSKDFKIALSQWLLCGSHSSISWIEMFIVVVSALALNVISVEDTHSDVSKDIHNQPFWKKIAYHSMLWDSDSVTQHYCVLSFEWGLGLVLYTEGKELNNIWWPQTQSVVETFKVSLVGSSD